MHRARKDRPRGDADSARPVADRDADTADALGGRLPNPQLGDEIRQAELAFILGTDPPAPGSAAPALEPAPWGIALSGGGIRSATFSLGVLQALAENGLLRCFHYQSSISGGGYAGAFLQGLIGRGGFDYAFAVLASHVGDEDLQKPILHLREYSNYLSPRKKLLSGDTLGMVGTYVRNVVLIQIQLLALMVALGLLPLLLYPYLLLLGEGYGTVICLGGAGACGVGAACLLERISRHVGSPAPASSSGARTRNPLGSPRAEQPGQKVLGQALAIVYLVAAAVTLGALGLWPPQADPTAGTRLAAPISLPFMATISGCYLIVWAMWLIKALRARGRASSSTDPLGRFFAATVVTAALAGPLLAGLRALAFSWFGGNALRVITFGPSCVLAAVMLTGIMHVGLAGHALTDLQREMWARVAGKATAAVLGLGATLLMVIYGPWLMLAIWGKAQQSLHTVAWLSTVTWLLTTGAGVLAAHGQKVSGAKARASPLELLVRVAPSVFLIGLLIAVSLTTQLAVRGIPAVGSPGACMAGDYVGNLACLAAEKRLWITMAFVGMLAIWGVFGFAIDLNEFSMNAFYRNRLVRCYLGASHGERAPEPTTNFDPDDDMTLAEVVQQHRAEGNKRPLYPLIGTTLNLVDTKQLDWQDRKAASFLFTPGYCGYVPPPSHPKATAIGDSCVPGLPCTADAGACNDAPLLANRMRLGSAVAISGAAVSPNMGYHSSPVVTLLLTLFDARLGWWLPNPNGGQSKRASQVTFYGEWLVREMLGRTREEGDFIYLSDGGHFENLGLYELVRRRCEFILCVDSSADPDRCFADLGNAIQKCRTDFGYDIDIDVSDLRCGPDGISRRHCAVGRITYTQRNAATAGAGETAQAGPQKQGILFYVKPSLTGNESADVAYYARAHPAFPHESTADQYFDEAQFESYRRLGRTIATAALETVIKRARAESDSCGSDGFGLHESDLKSSFLRELQDQWTAPLKGMDEHFSRHAHDMASLFAKLRKEPSLSVLDAHLYPAWNDIARSTPWQKPGELTALPADNDFRACFYFCQELVQLMESVYCDLDLEHAWSHPDNRGWLNAFRQWSWSPMFRIAWATGAPTYGKPFVTFCELHLNLPALEKLQFTTLEDYPTDADNWMQRCESLLAERRINALERSILISPALTAPADGTPPDRILLLRLKWKAIMVRAACDLGDTTVAIAVMAGSRLRVLRIQDHVRHMGLALVFMRHMAAHGVPFTSVDIQAGNYGDDVGVYTPAQAVAYNQRLNAMRLHARSVSSR